MTESTNPEIDWDCEGCGESILINGVYVQTRAWHNDHIMRNHAGKWVGCGSDFEKDKYSTHCEMLCSACDEEVTPEQADEINRRFVIDSGR